MRRIGELLELGLNLAGIRMVLVLEAGNRLLGRDLTTALGVRTSPNESRKIKGIR